MNLSRTHKLLKNKIYLLLDWYFNYFWKMENTPKIKNRKALQVDANLWFERPLKVKIWRSNLKIFIYCLIFINKILTSLSICLAPHDKLDNIYRIRRCLVPPLNDRHFAKLGGETRQRWFLFSLIYIKKTWKKIWVNQIFLICYEYINNNSYFNLDDGGHIIIVWSCSSNAVKIHNVSYIP